MVVFGAGASYDSVPARPAKHFRQEAYRPPLAQELFDDRSHFVEAMNYFPSCKPVIPILRNKEKSIEQTLEGFRTQTVEYPERHKQIAAIKFYLRHMISRNESHWRLVSHDITNYVTLLDQINRMRGHEEKVCLVTFNYDTMLEDAVGGVGIKIKTLDDYINGGNFMLFKLHGSVNWVREIDIKDLGRNSTEELINRASELKISNTYHIFQQTLEAMTTVEGKARVLFPAIAIPVELKTDYECPEEHVNLLREHIPYVQNLLVIGWKASEHNFLKLLADEAKNQLNVTIVAGGKEYAREIEGRFKNVGIKGNFNITDYDFTEFVVNERIYSY